MRQIETKNGKKWRCIQSIQATKKSTEQRDAFGKSITAHQHVGESGATLPSAQAEAHRLDAEWICRWQCIYHQSAISRGCVKTF
ncbi:MAG: hypothetical protein D4R84_17280 [Rhodocyclaceae bacterium]|nr:MAG: hypothetical protein D4R84_17280 [Rhodocyclaceae bacterium]